MLQGLPLAVSSLLALPLAALLNHVQTCSRKELLRLYRLGLVCRCEWFDDFGYGLRSSHCENGVPIPGFAPCCHQPESTLPDQVCGVVLARLWPRQYAEPLTDAPSAAASKEARYSLLLSRARRGRRLHHADDAQQAGIDGTPFESGITMKKNRNGSVQSLGIVDLRTLDGSMFKAKSLAFPIQPRRSADRRRGVRVDLPRS